MKFKILFLFNFIFSISITAQQWTNYTTANGLINNTVFSVAIDKQGNKWFGTAAGLSEFDSTWNTFTSKNGLSGSNVYVIAIDSLGNKWFGSIGGGLSEFNSTGWTTYTTATPGIPSNNVYSIAFDRKGNKWIGTDQGLSVFGKGHWVNYNSNFYQLLNNNVNTVAIDKNGTAWCGTDSGLSVFDGTYWNNYTVADGLVDNDIRAIAIDSVNNVWIATYGGGVSEFSDSAGCCNNYYQSYEGLASNFVNSVAIDSQGNKWFGTEEGGVSMFDGTYWTTYNTSNGLPDDDINSIAIDSKGNKWFGTEVNGVSKLIDLYLYTSADSLFISGAANSSGTFNITSNTSWTIVDTTQDWITTNINTGSDNAVIKVTALANNTDTTRYDTLILIGNGTASKRVIISQATPGAGISHQLMELIKLYPNPVIDKLIIDIPVSLSPVNLEIFSLRGELVYSKNLIYNQVEIDMSGYNSGLYFVRIMSPDQGTFVKKIVVTHK